MASGMDWFAAFDQFRISVGALFPAFPLMPARIHGKWVRSPARVQDFNQGIKFVLSCLGSKSSDGATSHGMKATLLSWACDFGIREDFRAAL
eukprot:4323307-Karenia_brevis.AAC.1